MAKRAASSSSSAKGAGKGHPFGEDGGTLMATNADVSDPPGNAEERAAKHRRGEGQDAGTDSHTDAGSERGEINALEVDDEEIKQLSAWKLKRALELLGDKAQGLYFNLRYKESQATAQLFQRHDDTDGAADDYDHGDTVISNLHKARVVEQKKEEAKELAVNLYRAWLEDNVSPQLFIKFRVVFHRIQRWLDQH